MFQSLEKLSADPILGLIAAYHADENPLKIDMGVGVYKDEHGNTPIMSAVKKAEQRLLASQQSKAYVGPAGDEQYNELVAELILGKQLVSDLNGRRSTFQTPGGCGGLRLAAEFIKRASPDATIWVSDPTWPNHVPLLGSAGLNIKTYPYYDYKHHSIRFDEMIAALKGVSSKDLVLLHGCCHNPCGADPNQQQWQQLRDLALEIGFTVFIDLAYQGLGDGIFDDAYGVRLMAESLPELIVVSSCSKNFGLYRDRVGALTVICESNATLPAVSSQIASVARGMYSMPPDHGGVTVQMILSDPTLKAEWDMELTEMRDRLNGIRAMFASKLKQAGVPRDFDFIQQEKGLFSFLGITQDQIKTLVHDYSIYMVDSSRVNLAGINNKNIDYLIECMTKIID